MFVAQPFAALRFSADTADCFGFVESLMLGARTDLEIPQAIICAVAILMMHQFCWAQWASQMFSHYEPVLLHVSMPIGIWVAAPKDIHISIMDEPTASPRGMKVWILSVESQTACNASRYRLPNRFSVPRLAAIYACHFLCFWGVHA